MATSLAEVKRWTNDRRDARLRNVGQAIVDRMGRQGYAWLSERTLFREICHCGWAEGLELVAELVGAGEFCRVTARGRGCGKGRTLYFKCWVSQNVIRHELEENAMPMAAFHAVEAFFAAYRHRLSLFRQRNDAAQHQPSFRHSESTNEKVGRFAPDPPSRASHGPPGSSPSKRPASSFRADTALSRHGAALRRLRAEQERLRGTT